MQRGGHVLGVPWHSWHPPRWNGVEPGIPSDWTRVTKEWGEHYTCFKHWPTPALRPLTLGQLPLRPLPLRPPPLRPLPLPAVKSQRRRSLADHRWITSIACWSATSSRKAASADSQAPRQRIWAQLFGAASGSCLRVSFQSRRHQQYEDSHAGDDGHDAQNPDPRAVRGARGLRVLE